MKNNKKYIEPEFKVIETKKQDIMTASGDDFNMRGDQANHVYYKNTTWTIDI